LIFHAIDLVDNSMIPNHALVGLQIIVEQLRYQQHKFGGTVASSVETR
jgi:hypothetical protein